MRLLSVNYDLNSPGQDYGRLDERVKMFYPDRIKGLKSTWFIATNDSAEQVFKNLAPAIDASDRIFVNRITHEHRGWLSTDVVEWLTSRLRFAA